MSGWSLLDSFHIVIKTWQIVKGYIFIGSQTRSCFFTTGGKVPEWRSQTSTDPLSEQNGCENRTVSLNQYFMGGLCRKSNKILLRIKSV